MTKPKTAKQSKTKGRRSRASATDFPFGANAPNHESESRPAGVADVLWV